jgi:hypothetical protein
MHACWVLYWEAQNAGLADSERGELWAWDAGASFWSPLLSELLVEVLTLDEVEQTPEYVIRTLPRSHLAFFFLGALGLGLAAAAALAYIAQILSE